MIKAIKLTFALIVTTFSATTFADSLPERIDLFVSLFDYDSAVDFYDIRGIQTDYPTRLLTPESMLPQTAQYPIKDIQMLYKLALNCAGNLPLNPLVTEPLVFTRATCKGTQLSSRWFARSGLIHPEAAHMLNVM